MKSSYLRSLGSRSVCMALALLGVSTSSYAQNYAGVLSLTHMRSAATFTLIGFSSAPPNTCSNWDAHIRVNHTTADGKVFMASLMLAHATGRAVDVWYTNTTTPGTTNAACTGMATLTGVRVR